MKLFIIQWLLLAKLLASGSIVSWASYPVTLSGLSCSCLGCSFCTYKEKTNSRHFFLLLLEGSSRRAVSAPWTTAKNWLRSQEQIKSVNREWMWASISLLPIPSHCHCWCCTGCCGRNGEVWELWEQRFGSWQPGRVLLPGSLTPAALWPSLNVLPRGKEPAFTLPWKESSCQASTKVLQTTWKEAGAVCRVLESSWTWLMAWVPRKPTGLFTTSVVAHFFGSVSLSESHIQLQHTNQHHYLDWFVLAWVNSVSGHKVPASSR